jgi:hypothetical protein
MLNLGNIGCLCIYEAEFANVDEEVGNGLEGVGRVETNLESPNVSDITEFSGEDVRGKTYDFLPLGRKAGNTRRATARESLLARAMSVSWFSYLPPAVKNSAAPLHPSCKK